MKNKNFLMNICVMLLFCGVITAQNQNQQFLNAQFLILNQIQPLTQDEKDRISDIFNDEFAESNNQAEAFKFAMSCTLEEMEYYESYYSTEISSRALFLYNFDLKYYKRLLQNDETELELIKPILMERSQELALYEMRVFAYPDILLTIKEMIKEKYFESLSAVYLPSVIAEASHDLCLALQLRTRLELEGPQIDSLVFASYAIKQLAVKGIINQRDNNCWIYERDFILDILDDEQATHFAFALYSDYAMDYAHQMWEEGKSFKMTSEYDSVQVIKELHEYRANWALYQYIYRDDKEAMRDTEVAVNKYLYPDFLTQLMAKRRKQEAVEIDYRNYLVF